MTKAELLVEIEKCGGKIEPIKQHCQFQSFGKSFLEYCVQPLNSPYRINLGSAGGPAVVCDGPFLPIGYKTRPIEGKEVREVEYEKVEPCPFKVNGKILGWRIMLPAGD